MANLNKVMLIGRLTNDPESRSFSNGGKVTNFRFAANNRKKNMSTGQWEDEPMFIDVKVFNRGEQGKQADLAAETLRKGHQVFLEGHLVFEQWEDKNGGGKRSKHVIVVDNFQFLERREDGAAGQGGSRFQGSAPATRKPSAPPPEDHFQDADPGMSESPHEDIPF